MTNLYSILATLQDAPVGNVKEHEKAYDSCNYYYYYLMENTSKSFFFFQFPRIVYFAFVRLRNNNHLFFILRIDFQSIDSILKTNFFSTTFNR